MTEKESRWQKWLKENANKDGKVTPLDLFNPYTDYAENDMAKSRMDICNQCEFLTKATHQCTKCGCFMKLKTKLLHATCPISKW